MLRDCEVIWAFRMLRDCKVIWVSADSPVETAVTVWGFSAKGFMYSITASRNISGLSPFGSIPMIGLLSA